MGLDRTLPHADVLFMTPPSTPPSRPPADPTRGVITLPNPQSLTTSIRATAQVFEDPQSVALLARIRRIHEVAGLALRGPKMGVERYLELMAGDKKVDSGRIRYILMRRLGESYVGELSSEVVASALEAGCA